MKNNTRHSFWMAVLHTAAFAITCTRAVQDILFWHNRSGNGTPYATLLLALVTGGCALAWWLTWKRNKNQESSQIQEDTNHERRTEPDPGADL